MPIYDYKGVQYDIETADPEEAKRKILAHIGPEKGAVDYAKDFGKGAASLADTALNAVTGALDYAAYPMARAFGRTPEQATAETTSPKDVIGTALGITQDPAYQRELSRKAMGAVGEGVQAVAKPISTATGLPGSDVENMLGSGMLLAGAKAQPYINRAGQAVGQAMYAAEPYVTGAAKAPVSAPLQFGKGLVEGLANKQYNPATSAMVPLRDTYTPPAAAQRFMGELPGVPRQTLSQLESQARPTSELVGGRAGQLAQAISPKTTAGETLVPLQGQGMQAFGERVGRGVRTNPLQAMGEIGLTALTGIPFKTLAQGVGELGARYLGNKTGFAPGFSNQVGAAQAQTALQPTQPRLGYNPTAAGPVAPPTIYTGAGGASADLAAAGQAALNTKYPPMPAATAPAAPTGISQTPQQMAAARIQPGLDPARQAAADTVLAQIRARGETEKAARVAALQSRAAAAGGYTPPRVEAPVAPVAPTAMPTAAPAPAAPVSTLDTLRGRLTPMTAEQQAAVDAYNAKPPVEKAAQTRAETAAKSVAQAPAPVVKSTMPTKSISENNTLPSANAVAVDPAGAAAYKAQNPNYNIKYDVVSTEGKGKKAKQVLTEVNEQAVDNKKFKAQPDVIITEKITKTSSTGVDTVFKGRTVDGVPIEITNLNSKSYNGPKVYAVVNGKKHLVREFSAYGEEVHYVVNDKTAKQLGVNLKPTQNLPPEDITNISARGFKPDPETPFHHEFTDPTRYDKYQTTGVDPKGVWETDLARAKTYKEKQAQAAAKAAAKKAAEGKE